MDCRMTCSTDIDSIEHRAEHLFKRSSTKCRNVMLFPSRSATLLLSDSSAVTAKIHRDDIIHKEWLEPVRTVTNNLHATLSHVRKDLRSQLITDT